MRNYNDPPDAWRRGAGMTVADFENALRALIGDVETSDMNTPCEAIAAVLDAERKRIEGSGYRFMHEFLKDY
jgi:hypothetical protein